MQIRENKQMCFVLGLLLSNQPWPAKQVIKVGMFNSRWNGRAQLQSGSHFKYFLPQLILLHRREIQKSLQVKALALLFLVFLNSYWEEAAEGNIAITTEAVSAFCQSLQSDPCLIHTSKQSQGIKVTK